MKQFGRASIIIATLGFIIIQYFHYEFSLKSEGLGEIVEFYVYGRTNKKFLILSQLLGLGLGLMSNRKNLTRSGVIGAAFCIINLFILSLHSY